MTTLRLAQIQHQVKAAKRRFDLRAAQWGARIEIMGTGPIAYTIPGRKPVYAPWAEEAMRTKAMNRSWLPAVTVTEHAWLLAQNLPKTAKWTRLHGAEGWMDCEPMVQSRNPIVREVWVGARSLGCVPGESASSESEGLSASQREQEEAAETTDLITLTYQDPSAFWDWVRTEARARRDADGAKRRHLNSYRHEILAEVPCDETGEPLMAMIEDEHCECRPIRNGDVVTVAHGSNEDLDALFLEEGDDPRVQNDQGAEGSDHRWSGRFRANTPLEEEFLTNSCFTKRGSGQHITPNSNPVVADLRWQPDELTMRRVAQGLVARMLERHPKWSDHLLKLTDEAEANLKRMAADLQIEDGVVTHGYFITKDEFFGTIEANHARCERELARPRARPAAVDWNLVRDPASNRKRELEQFRNRLKAQLVS